MKISDDDKGWGLKFAMTTISSDGRHEEKSRIIWGDWEPYGVEIAVEDKAKLQIVSTTLITKLGIGEISGSSNGVKVPYFFISRVYIPIGVETLDAIAILTPSSPVFISTWLEVRNSFPT